MEVRQAAENPAKRIEETVRGNFSVRSSGRKQFLGSARGHYLSALAGLNADAAPIGEANALEEEGKLGHPKTFAQMDTQTLLPKGLLNASEKKEQDVNVQFKKTLAKNTKAQIPEMVSRTGAFEKETETVEVPPHLGGVKKSPLKRPREGSSLQDMVQSLKTELENLKKEHAVLRDKDSGAEFGARNLDFKLLKSKSKKEGCFAKEAKVPQTFEEVTQDEHEVEDLKVKGKRLFVEVEKRPRLAMDVDEEKEATVSGLHQSKSLPGRIHAASVSTSESSARIMTSEDELESSSKKAEKSDNLDNGKLTGEIEAKELATMSTLDRSRSLPKGIYAVCVSTSESSPRIMISEDELESSSRIEEKSDKLGKGKLTAITGDVDADKYDYASEFSIRDYVFGVRNKDISMNWPFSQKNLQLCLKHGVTDVLPPFEHMDFLRDSSMRRCLAEKSLPSEESNLDERPKSHLVPGATIDNRWNQELNEGNRDSDSFPFGGDNDLAFKTGATANSQSVVESVSTSNLPSYEVSDEQRTRSSASPLSNKKCRVAVKFCVSINRSACEDITSSCVVPSETMASKICPVCENFSSSSNTTLNAHIDQCLSFESTPNWMKNSGLIKPRIKPRKMRLMDDIYATAPRCTLEDLDRRNGTNWATNTDFPSQKNEVISERRGHGVSSRYVVNKHDDTSVYIDSNGRKIRILSKFNDISSPSFAKAGENVRPKKQSRKGKTSKFFPRIRKKHLAKHLQYLKVSRQRKWFSTVKVKRCSESDKAYGAEEARHVEEPKNAGASGTPSQGISSKRSNMSTTNDSEDISKLCRYKLRTTKDLLAGSDQPERTHVKKHSSSPMKSLSSLQSSLRTSGVYGSTMARKSESTCGRKTINSCSLRGERETFLVPMTAQLNGENTKEGIPKSMDSSASRSSSLEREIENQGDATGGNTDSSFHGKAKLLHGGHVSPFEGITTHDSKTNKPEYVRACQSISKRKGSTDENSCSEITDSLGSGSMMEVRRKQQALDHVVDVPKGTNGLADEIQGEHACFTSASRLGRGENMICSRGSELQEVAYVSEPFSTSTHSSDKVQGSLFRAEARVHPNQPCLSDDHEMFYGNIVGTERLDLKTGDSDCDLGGGQTSFLAVDPIPIPGPPGSDLPSFSDMGSEDLHSDSSSLAQSSGDGDGDDGADGHPPDCPLSATSTIDDLTFREPESLRRVSLPVSDDVYPLPGWLGQGASSGTPMMGFSTMFSHAASIERITSLVDSSEDSVIVEGRGAPLALEGDHHQCCCSRREGIPWSAALNLEESQLLGQKMMTMVTFPTGKHTSSALNGRLNSLDSTTAVFSSGSCPRTDSENTHSIGTSQISGQAGVLSPRARAGNCESLSTSAPVLRLMGKDLMVIKEEEYDLSRVRARAQAQAFQNVSTNNISVVGPSAEMSSFNVQRDREHRSPQSKVSIGGRRPILHEQDSHTWSAQVNMINFRAP